MVWDVERMGDVVRTPWSTVFSVCGRRWRFFQIESDIDVASGGMLR